MLKSYRIKKLKEKIASLEAQYNELGKIMDSLESFPSYYIDKRIRISGLIAEFKIILKSVEES